VVSIYLSNRFPVCECIRIHLDLSAGLYSLQAHQDNEQQIKHQRPQQGQQRQQDGKQRQQEGQQEGQQRQREGQQGQQGEGPSEEGTALADQEAGCCDEAEDSWWRRLTFSSLSS
jgi:hypothetical protein